ncbi:MAG TPA: alpha/beta fold hydrolase [Burkholderiales bacterium]|nr:alpha/beta fold hydrolase [Burkholderiales bacterium]
MPFVQTDDGVRLHCEETGAGSAIVFVHEFAGDHRSWEPQVRHFSRRYRCVTYAARGYPPSEVPEDVERYSQARARDDVRDVMDALEIERAHVVGLSMGSFAALHFGMAYPARALSLVVAGCGYGAHPAQHARFQEESRALAKRILEAGMAEVAATYGHGPSRVQYQAKDPRGFAEFERQLAAHSARGSANTMLGYQARRPSLYALVEDLKRLAVPTLVVAGDEDDATLEPGLLMKRAIPGAALAVLPKTGHIINLEEPALFNQLVESFFHQVEAGRWSARDRRSPVESIYGPGGKP